jgi:hypothetical protein
MILNDRAKELNKRLGSEFSALKGAQAHGRDKGGEIMR